ncbi:MAG: aminotransferase class I/II-fold pyridoxal phosphate-dependent enzyme, partial [Gammaproteobacteria bacterium]|nr:aminotransferase class I/II-fold pyridoxal phosphate-dependent enzyme [Gammaproteobacteria bacterium]
NEDAALTQMRDIYWRRRDLLLEKLGAIAELNVFKPDAGMFLMVDVRGTGLQASEFVQQLYADTGVSVLDATAFGASAEGFVRVSYATDEDKLEQGCQRIVKFIDSLRPISQAV